MDGGLTVYLFNVGQGDHLLLELPNGEYGIIDFYFDGRLGMKEPPALSFLDARRKQHPDKPIVISFIYLSHPDHDHVKGADTFLQWVQENEVQLKRLWLFAGRNVEELVTCLQKVKRELPLDSSAKSRINNFHKRFEVVNEFIKDWRHRPVYLQNVRLLGELAEETRAISIAPLDYHIQRFDDQAMEDFCRFILSEEKTKSTDKSAETNLVSSILMIIFKNHRLLFGGDTGKSVWAECLDHYTAMDHMDQYGPVKADFIKASHHGSKNSSSVELWKRILDQATCVGISAGRNKKYGHPHCETITDIQAASSQLDTAVQIFSTNVCSGCLGVLQLDTQSVDWWVEEVDPLKAETRVVLNQITQKPLPAASTNPVLAAYVFRFDPSSNYIKVDIAVNPGNLSNPDCIYDDPAASTFPGCAN